MAKKKGKSKAQKQPSLQGIQKITIARDTNSGVIADVFNSVVQPPALLKVCRLCETKDGPFLNIFGAEQGIAKKIDDLLPFSVQEYDDLPHKICFRCSAKVEELHDFVQKCVSTQDNLRKILGKKSGHGKSNVRKIWEDKLNQSNMSNDEICDAVVMQAMKGIKGLAPEPKLSDDDEENLQVTKAANNARNVEPSVNKNEILNNMLNSSSGKRKTDSNSEIIKKPKLSLDVDKSGTADKLSRPEQTSDLSSDCDDDEPVETPKSKDPEKPKEIFDITKHMSKIKVNGVGVLYQCSLCNRNFLKQEIILTHGCAKTGIPKTDLTSRLPPPTFDPPRNPMSTVKYINNAPNINKVMVKPDEPVKSKPRIGPASRVKKTEDIVPTAGTSPEPAPVPPLQGLQFPLIPGMNGQLRLVPGPNNTYILVADPPNLTQQTNNTTAQDSVPREPPVEIPDPVKEKKHKEKGKKKISTPKPDSDDDDIVWLDKDQEKSVQQPYPVGLIRSFGGKANINPNSYPIPTFTTPAMKKQSYTVVQTGHPSKLLISTRQNVEQVNTEKPKPKSKKKSKHDPKPNPEPVSTFSLASGEQSLGSKSVFKFFNVDDSHQPSFVLPNDNRVQESQVTTSSSAEIIAQTPYPCTMCPERFSREKKLFAHLKAHYVKMDEESKASDAKSPKRKTRRS